MNYLLRNDLVSARLAIGEVVVTKAVVVAFAIQIGTPPVRRRDLCRVLHAVMMGETDCVKLGITAADWALMAGVASDNWLDRRVHVPHVKPRWALGPVPKVLRRRVDLPYSLVSRRS